MLETRGLRRNVGQDMFEETEAVGAVVALWTSSVSTYGISCQDQHEGCSSNGRLDFTLIRRIFSP